MRSHQGDLHVHTSPDSNRPASVFSFLLAVLPHRGTIRAAGHSQSGIWRQFRRLILMFALLLTGLEAQPWYNSSWSYRKPITINDSQVSGSSNLTNFPVLISLPSDSN